MTGLKRVRALGLGIIGGFLPILPSPRIHNVLHGLRAESVSEITTTARTSWLAAIMFAAAACGGPSLGSSDGGGASTIDWEKVGAYDENCSAPFESSVSQLEEDSTNAEWSEALGEDIEAWESQDVPDALDAYHKATIDMMKEVKKVVDSQPRDSSVWETFDNEEIGEGLEDDVEAAEEAWAKTTPLVRYRLGESRCVQNLNLDVNVDLTHVDDYVAWCGSYSCDFSVWYVERDAKKLTFDVALINPIEDTLLPLPDCGENLVVRDGNGTFYGASSCEFRGNIRDGKVLYEDSPEEASVGIALEYELPESASDLELLAAFELDNEDGYYEENYAEGFIIGLSDIEP